MKKLIIAVASFFALLLILLLTVPFFIDINKFSSSIEAKIEAVTGLDAELGEMKLAILPVPSFRIKGLLLRENGQDKSLVHFDKLRIRPAILPLLKKKVRIRSLIIDGPVIDLPLDKDWGSKIEKEKSEKTRAGGIPDFRINSFKINDGVVRLYSAGMDHSLKEFNLEFKDLSTTSDWSADLSALHENSGQKLNFKGDFGPLDVEKTSLTSFLMEAGKNVFSGSAEYKDEGTGSSLGLVIKADKTFDVDELLNLSTSGEREDSGKKSSDRRRETAGAPSLRLAADFSADNAVYSGIRISKLDAVIRYENNIVSISPVSFKFYDGDFDAEGKITMVQGVSRYDFSSDIRQVDVGALIKDYSGEDNIISGKLVSEMHVKGPDITSDNVLDEMKGKGGFEIFEGRLESFGLQNKINLLLGLTGEGSAGKDYTEFKKFAGDVEIKKGRVYAENVKLLSEAFDLDAEGSMTFAGVLDFNVRAVLSPEMTEKAGSSEYAGYLKNEDGRTVVPMKVKGNVSDPEFSLDKSLFKNMAGKKLEKEAREAFKKLFD